MSSEGLYFALLVRFSCFSWLGKRSCNSQVNILNTLPYSGTILSLFGEERHTLKTFKVTSLLTG